MTTIEPPFVTGISSVSGGGKTAVCGKLAELLGDSVTLYLDDYDKTNIHPENLSAWLKDGGDYNAWRTPLLTKDLQALTTGNPITSPIDGAKISPVEHIVFDAPLGRATVTLDGLLISWFSSTHRLMSLWPAACCVKLATPNPVLMRQ